MRNIVLEGPDNAGKTTLAAKLNAALGFPIKHSGGPSKYPGEVNERAKEFNADDNLYIYDRHPCISQNVYVKALNSGGELVTEENLEAFYNKRPIIIYCKSKGTLEGHNQSEHSSEEYFNQVERSYPQLCLEYDLWSDCVEHLTYQIGDSEEALLDKIKAKLQKGND